MKTWTQMTTWTPICLLAATSLLVGCGSSESGPDGPGGASSDEGTGGGTQGDGSGGASSGSGTGAASGGNEDTGGSGNDGSDGGTGGGEHTPDDPPSKEELGCHPGAGGTMVDARDGQAYCTTTINGKRWLAQNLRFVPSKGKHWCPEDDAKRCAEYGVLYWWGTAIGMGDAFNEQQASAAAPAQGVCPVGWHLPSKKEFISLLDFIRKQHDTGGLDYEGKLGSQYLRSATKDWIPTPSTETAKNEYGFWARPAGVMSCGKTCNPDSFGYKTSFWSSTELSATKAMAVELRSDADARVFDKTSNSNSNKDEGRSIRCIED